MGAFRDFDAPVFKDLTSAIRALAMDAVQKANSGHPGMPMGMAEIAEVLWIHHLRHNPANPKWSDRDRFVLSNGHGSMLIYALLHLTGYDLPMEEIKHFRQLHSKTPGIPSMGTHRGWKPPPVLWDRDSPMQWAWRWQKKYLPLISTVPVLTLSTTTPTYFWATVA